MRLQIATLILCAIVTFGFTSQVFAGDSVGLPAPTSTAEGQYPSQKTLFTLCGAKFSYPGLLGRYTPSYWDVV